MGKVRETALEHKLQQLNAVISAQQERIAELESLVRDMYGYIESDYPPSKVEPFEQRMRELGVDE